MITDVEEPITETQEETTTETTDPVDDLDQDFENFRKSTSTHSVETETETEEATDEFMPDESDLNAVEEFKVQMFLGFCFTLLDGFHVWVYKYISKYELSDDELSLSEKEQEALMGYFKTKRVLEIINRIPPELIGLVHMEYMYYRKYRQIAKQKEEQEKKFNENKKQLLIEAHNEITKKKAAKKEPVKKETTKKQPAKKKAAKKKETTKETK